MLFNPFHQADETYPPPGAIPPPMSYGYGLHFLRTVVKKTGAALMGMLEVVLHALSDISQAIAVCWLYSS